MCAFDNDEFVDKACETCAHAYVSDMYGQQLSCEYNDKVVYQDWNETKNYMSCNSFGYERR
ncbi:hypothetical protein [Megamonas hypermegale]|uniref:hypothetical protein n=1 Tax=Megamonas hypermegale TaxID=158847 RepID=UPI0026EED553|nr:hypothetical protein [Megamonas hypermegale]